MTETSGEKEFVPFEVWYLKRHPDHCATCLGSGKLEGRLPMTGLKHIIECPDCGGTGGYPYWQMYRDSLRAALAAKEAAVEREEASRQRECEAENEAKRLTEELADAFDREKAYSRSILIDKIQGLEAQLCRAREIQDQIVTAKSDCFHDRCETTANKKVWGELCKPCKINIEDLRNELYNILSSPSRAAIGAKEKEGKL